MPATNVYPVIVNSDIDLTNRSNLNDRRARKVTFNSIVVHRRNDNFSIGEPADGAAAGIMQRLRKEKRPAVVVIVVVVVVVVVISEKLPQAKRYQMRVTGPLSAQIAALSATA